MQPYFDPTRKTTSKKMEDDLKKMKMKDDLYIFFKARMKPFQKNGRRPPKKNQNRR